MLGGKFWNTLVLQYYITPGTTLDTGVSEYLYYLYRRVQFLSNVFYYRTGTKSLHFYSTPYMYGILLSTVVRATGLPVLVLNVSY